jgi:RNA polymerase primary sigma factor
MAKQESSPRGKYRHSLERYLDEISEIPLINAQDEIDLTRRIKQGDSQALAILIKSNLRFVVRVAKEYQNQGLPLSDLINEGNLGLIEAAKRFDETRGFKFISYGVWWIRQSILKALADHSRVVRLPLNRLGTITKVNQASKDLEQRYNREPTFQEISQKLEIPVSEISMAVRNSSYHVSLDQPLNRYENGTMKEVIQNPNSIMPDNHLLEDSLKNEIKRVLKTLSPREESVVKMYFGIDHTRPYTLEEIGERLKLTRERIRQIKERALIRLRHQSRSKNLRLFL